LVAKVIRHNQRGARGKARIAVLTPARARDGHRVPTLAAVKSPAAEPPTTNDLPVAPSEPGP